MKTISIGPDCSTATGIATFIRDRVEELKAEARGSYEDEPAIKELLAVGHAIEIDIDKMIDDMYAENQERARQQTINLQDAGLTISEVKERYEF